MKTNEMKLIIYYFKNKYLLTTIFKLYILINLILKKSKIYFFSIIVHNHV